MATSKSGKRKSRGFPPPPDKAPPRPTGPSQPPRRYGLVALFLLISIGGTYLAIWMRPRPETDRFRYEVVEKYPHDPNAFTQGLIYDQGFLWESTGRYGESTIRKTDLKSGEVIDQESLGDELFGEGLTILNDQLYQITWKSGRAFVYDRELNRIKEFQYKGQGWGLTTNGQDLVFSNGTAEIKFLDPATFEERRSIWVRRKSGLSVGKLNELEYYGGKIYANSLPTDLVYEIDPDDGRVTKIIDFGGLWPMKDRPTDGVLNGLAINTDTKRFLVTGKLCPFVYEVRLFPEPQ